MCVIVGGVWSVLGCFEGVLGVYRRCTGGVKEVFWVCVGGVQGVCRGVFRGCLEREVSYLIFSLLAHS